MNPRTLFFFYVWRLRAHPLQELFAGLGLAVGVALLFAVQVANSSIANSVEHLFHGITGSAQIEVASGDEHGFDERFVAAMRQLPGVAVAAPTLQRRAIVRGPGGSQQVALVGVDTTLADLGGSLTREFGEQGLLLPERGVVLPDQVARSIGANPRGSVLMLVAGRAFRVRVAATLGSDQIGGAAASPLVIARLAYAQQLAGMPGDVTQAYVSAKTGQDAVVRREIARLGAGTLATGSANALVQRLRGATAANDQSTLLFSAISAMVGVLFAFNAMLLTMPERRRFLAELRMQGFTGRQIVAVLGFQALMLGIEASLLGLLLGDLLSRGVFQSVPTYLAFTFPVGAQRVVTPSAIALAAGAGILAALLAACRPLFDLFARHPLDAPYQEAGEVGEAIDGRLRRRMVIAALAIMAVIAVVVTFEPTTAVAGMVALAVATLLIIPSAFAVAMPAIQQAASQLNRNLLLVAVIGTRAAMTRSVAVAAIAALAVFGATALTGARADMVQGLHRGYDDHLRTADIWVTTAGRSLTTDSFKVTQQQLARLRGTPDVASVRIYQGGMYDIGSRRVWLIARPADDGPLLPPSQLVRGNLTEATARVRAGGWVAVSATLADDLDLHVGGNVTLPTPTGRRRMKVAAVVTNLSWGPGAVILNTEDYRRDWRTGDPSAIEVDLRDGVSPAAGKRAVAQALGSTPALDVQTAAELDGEFRGILHDGLTRLSQISALMVIAAALALAAAMTVAVFQRRQRLASFKVQGFKERQLRRILLLEAAVVLILGCVLGLAAGVSGQAMGDQWLQATTGFPAHFSLQATAAAATVLPVLIGALAIVAVPAHFAVRVPPEATFHD